MYKADCDCEHDSEKEEEEDDDEEKKKPHYCDVKCKMFINIKSHLSRAFNF